MICNAMNLFDISKIITIYLCTIMHPKPQENSLKSLFVSIILRIFALEHRLIVLMGQKAVKLNYISFRLQRKPAGVTFEGINN